MNDIDSHELMLWSLLVGAMLIDNDTRQSVSSKLSPEDVPKQFADVWQCLIAGDKQGVRQCATGWRLEPWNDGTIPAVVRKLQEMALKRFLDAAHARMHFGASGLTPEQFKEKLHTLINRIEARELAIAKAKGMKPKTPDCNPPKTE
jgi:hypothetical protein